MAKQKTARRKEQIRRKRMESFRARKMRWNQVESRDHTDTKTFIQVVEYQSTELHLQLTKEARQEVNWKMSKAAIVGKDCVTWRNSLLGETPEFQFVRRVDLNVDAPFVCGSQKANFNKRSKGPDSWYQ